MRLVIDYKPLNLFLKDDQFSIPNRQAFFANLTKANIFSKFDLKVEFWQLEIKLEERFKTTFYIPDHHYQWTVMPFDLETAPSMFQKTMAQIFAHMAKNMLIYIDDLLVFSKDEASHMDHL